MKKVFVGVSGGVDSSVSAAILKEQGYDVTGVFIKVWHPDFLPCNWRNEMRDAMRVCAKLEIPFLFCDLSKEYKEGVIDYMIKEYSEGRTPNPDVMCNREVKFKHFLNFAIKNGADYIATGHYAQRIQAENDFELRESLDKNKDQTYFIWNLNQKILEKTLFPIGDKEKKEVRKIAKKFGLNTAEKKDSQGLCFIGDVNMKDFLKNFLKTKKGNVLNKKGEVIGQHDGSILYTIGQRHGFELFQKSNEEKIYYIVSKNIENNTITVSTSKKNHDSDDLQIEQVNLIRRQKLLREKVQVRIRYRQPLQEAKIIEQNSGSMKIKFTDKQDAVTVGQSLVLYQNGECLGGGIIV